MARAEFRGHAKTILSLAYSADGKTIASGSQDTTAKLWDAATGKEIFTLGGHTLGVLSVAFSPDSERLASAGQDGTVKFWDTRIDRWLVFELRLRKL